MEYVASRSLQDVLAQDGPLPARRVAEIGLGMLAALRAGHHRGVVHRDVKPGNVLLGEDGRVVLTDFGLATVPGDPVVTRTGLVLGSPAYISPERAHDGTAAPASDLWSLGATLYAAVEGQSPYARPSAIATLTALATEPPTPARKAGALKPVLTGLLRKDPAERISAEEAERLLHRAAGRRSRGGMALLPGVRRPLSERYRPRVAPVVGAAPVLPPRQPGVPAEPSGDPVEQPEAPAAGLDEQPAGSADASAEVASGGAAAAAGPSAAPDTAIEPAADDQSQDADPQAPVAEEPGESVVPAADEAEKSAAPQFAAGSAAVFGAGSADGGDSGSPGALDEETPGTRAEPLTAVEPAEAEPAAAEPAAAVWAADQHPSAGVRDEPVATGRAAVPALTSLKKGHTWLIGAAAAVVVLVVLLAVVLSNRDPGTVPRDDAAAPNASAGGGGGGASAPAAQQPSAPPVSPSPLAATPPPSAAVPANQAVKLPAGWHIYKNKRFQVAVPRSWTVEVDGTIVYFREYRGERRVLGIDWTKQPKSDPVADWKQQERQRSGSKPGYERVRIVAVDYWLKAADWEYRYNGNARLHAINRGFVTAKNRAHAILWITPDRTWEANLDEFAVITKSFRPLY
jgi:hypothetical protein